MSRGVGRSFSRPTRHYDQIIEPIREVDFLNLRKMLEESDTKTLSEYVESLSYFRMFVLGYIEENPLHRDRLDKIIAKLDQSRDDRKIVKLPEVFEAARKILLNIKEKEHFKRIFMEVQLARNQK